MIGARSRSALLNLRRRRCTPFWGMRSWLRCAGAARASAAAARAPRSSFVDQKRRATARRRTCGTSSGCGAVAWTSGVRNLVVVCHTGVLRSRAVRSVQKNNPRPRGAVYPGGARDVVLRRGRRGCFVSVLCVTSAPSDRVRPRVVKNKKTRQATQHVS